ncbi:MAG TPA: hypothetical protein VMR95_00465 [Candidatus Binatia bacterium]|nr:hypothetical protein [Candidatus Binatia bacterium]
MDRLINKVLELYPDLKFCPSDRFYWSPEEQIVYYQPKTGQIYYWKLLHEVSHALLGHKTYTSDIELLTLEVSAWEKAQGLAHDCNLSPIDNDYVQNCLDTYRDWLHKRSTCPTCGTRSLQESAEEYHCFNCQAKWRVSCSRFCRTYRQVKRSSTKALVSQQATFS